MGIGGFYVLIRKSYYHLKLIRLVRLIGMVTLPLKTNLKQVLLIQMVELFVLMNTLLFKVLGRECLLFPMKMANH